MKYIRMDPYLNMKLVLLCKSYDRLQYAKFKLRAVEMEGIPIGFSNNNPLIYSRQY